MKRIELLGPSGTGKTTLFLQICEFAQENRPFLTVREAFVKAALKENITISKPWLLLLQKIMKYGFFKSKVYGISKHIFQKYYSRQNDTHDLHQNYYVSFNILYQVYKKDLNPSHVMKRLKIFMSKVEEIDFLERNLPNNQMVLFDEGVLHHHFGVTTYGFDTFTEQELNSDKVLQPGGIIYCELSEEGIFQRAMQRKLNGVKTYSQGHLEGEDLRERIRITIKSNEQKIASFKKRNIPVLHINTEKPIEYNISKIVRFTRNLNKDRRPTKRLKQASVSV
ncbi:MAG: hypothetical protein ACFCU6_02220 [Balneolaceae bacterium]